MIRMIKTTRFPAQVDLGISVLLAGMAIACFGLGLVSAFIPGSPYFAIVLLLLTGVLIQSIWMRTFYEITETHLRVQCGPFWWRIPIYQITKAEKTSSLWLLMGGPHLRFALSKEAVFIRYQKSQSHKWFGLFPPAVLISPSDRNVFLETLQAASPDLTSNEVGNLAKQV